MNEKIGLVMEGGGFRGSYTAGALKWLYDHGIEMKYSASISAATSLALLYAAGEMEAMHTVITKGVKDPEVVGVKAFLNEGQIVGYGHLADKYLAPVYKRAYKTLMESDKEVEVGLFNMSDEHLQYFGKAELDPETPIYFEASCVLPVTGKMTTINGKRYLDGGIRTMVSIERSIATGHEKNLVIVTKDKNYVRKPNGFFLDKLLKIMYHKFPKMLAQLDNRVDNYYNEMGMVYDLEKQGKALLIRPTRDCGVGRFSGSEQQLEEMFQLGYQDMEDRKEEILKFLEIE